MVVAVMIYCDFHYTKIGCDRLLCIIALSQQKKLLAAKVPSVSLASRRRTLSFPFLRACHIEWVHTESGALLWKKKRRASGLTGPHRPHDSGRD